MCSSIKVPNNNPSKKFGFLNRKVQSTRTVLLFLFRLLDLFISGVPTNSFIWLNEQMDTKPPPGSKPNKWDRKTKNIVCCFFLGRGLDIQDRGLPLKKESKYFAHVHSAWHPVSALLLENWHASPCIRRHAIISWMDAFLISGNAYPFHSLRPKLNFFALCPNVKSRRLTLATSSVPVHKTEGPSLASALNDVFGSPRTNQARPFGLLRRRKWFDHSLLPLPSELFDFIKRGHTSILKSIFFLWFGRCRSEARSCNWSPAHAKPDFQLTFRPQKWNLKAHIWYQLSLP